jgi:uncharacterized RDD family membrane protein YckC
MDIDIAQARTPGLLRRLAAMLYDLILLFGMLLLAVTVVIIPYQALEGGAFPREGWLYHLHQIYLLCVAGGYYLFFWSRGGQTLGMRAWRFRLVRDDGGPPRLRDALRRLLWAVLTLAPAGVGLLWMLLDRAGLAWYDRLSHTRPVMTAVPGSERPTPPA